MPFVELLPCITLEVIQVNFVVTIAVALAKFQVYFEITQDLCDFGVGFESESCHVVLLR
jgi:hypothetical protein